MVAKFSFSQSIILICIGKFLSSSVSGSQLGSQKLCINEAISETDRDVKNSTIDIIVDDRELVSTTSCYPYSTIVQISIDQEGFGEECSGVLISPDFVLTLGACVFNYFLNSTLESATIYPAQNGQNLPFGSVKSEVIFVHPLFASESKLAYNVGLIKLQSSVGNETGWMSVNQTTIIDDVIEVYLQGYARDIGNNVQFRQQCIATIILRGEDDSEMFQHNCFTAQGVAGSPLYVKQEDDDSYKVLGIHSGFATANEGFGRINLATLLQDDLVEWILKILAE